MGTRSDGGKEGGGPAPGLEFAGVGFQFVAAILLFLYLGKWLDAKLGTAPWLLITGVFVGAGGGFYSMYRKLTRPPGR
jgi:F0F1-type ATP synthase assembly protein I